MGVVASLLVGLAFVVAGGSKISAGPQWPEQARGLGAPRVVIPVLPYVELVIGALLIVGLARPIAAIAALVLLVAFTVLIVRLLALGGDRRVRASGPGRPSRWGPAMSLGTWR